MSFDSIVFTDRHLLLESLYALGYTRIDEGTALALEDWHGRLRPETAEIVIRRRHLLGASNDVGFKLTEKGYVPIVSEFDTGALHGGKFLVKLRTAYSERVIAEVARRVHGTARRTVEQGVVKIRVRF